MNKKGFTLIELLAVIVILGIVVAIAIPGINSVIRNSRQKSLNSEAKIIQSAALRKTVGNPAYSFSHINKDNLKSELESDGSKFDYIGIDNNNGKITVTLIKDNMVGYSSNDDEITNAKIYGLHWDGGTGYTRLDDAEGLVASVGTDTLNPRNDFDYEDIYKDIIDVEEDGNMFVKIPRFYIKKEVSGNSWTWRISKKKHDESYYLPAVFQDQERGIILPSVLVGKYNASLDSTGTKLESRKGVLPLVNKNISEYRNYVTNIGVGYHLIDAHVIDILQTLFIVEFSTINSDIIMRGYTEGESPDTVVPTNIVRSSSSHKIELEVAASGYKVGQMFDIATNHSNRDVATNLRVTSINGNEIFYEVVPGISQLKKEIKPGQIVYNIFNVNGTTDSVLSKSGSNKSNLDGSYEMKYRGVENLYGSIWQLTDGLNIKNFEIYITDNYRNYNTLDYSNKYKRLNYNLVDRNVDSTLNFVKKLGIDSNNPAFNYPIEISSMNSSPYKDLSSTGSGNRILRYGGFHGAKKSAGIFILHFHAHDTKSITTGTRIIKRVN